jgi:hypothetical protein
LAHRCLQVHDIKYSNSGDSFLVISGTSQAKLYDRDGEEKYVIVRIASLKLTVTSVPQQANIHQGRSIYSGHATHSVSLPSFK